MFPPSSSILFVIMEVVLRLFEFVCGTSDLGLDKFEVLLVTSLGGDVDGLRTTCYVL